MKVRQIYEKRVPRRQTLINYYGIAQPTLKMVATANSNVQGIGQSMKIMFIPMILALALSVPTLSVPALAGNDKGNQGNGDGNGGNVRGAPGPLVGAGLPVLLIGGGIYWIVRRKKGQARNP